MPTPYLQPNFATLHTKSKCLKKQFYGLAELFILFSKKDHDKIMGWIELREEVLSLKAKYDQAAKEIWDAQSYLSRGFRFWGTVATSVGLSPTDRAGQIAALTDLIPLLKDNEPQTTALSGAKEGDPKKEDKVKDDKKRIYTLLGALFYRLLRIAQDYPSLDAAIAQSALCRAIYYQILGLSPKNKLDDWTVMTCCQFFYDFIVQNVTGLQVAYIKEDDKFLEKLKKIIADAAERAKPIINQLAYIDFVQSVAKTLAAFEGKLLPLLDEIEKNTTRTYNSSQAILTYLEQCQNPSADYHAYLKLVVANDNTEFSTDDTRSNAPKCLGEAIQQIKLRVASRNEYTLVGAYLAVLMCCTEGSWPLKHIMQEKILLHGVLSEVIVTADTGSLDFEARDISLTMLHEFVGLPEMTRSVDLVCWEHVAYLLREIDQEKIKFAPLLDKERAERAREAAEREAHQYSMTA